MKLSLNLEIVGGDKMYEKHDVFIEPEKANSKIWRYMDFTKFVSLLETSSLFFTRANKFDDPYEGVYPIYNRNEENRKMVYGEKYDEKMHETLTNFIRKYRKHTLINCWHCNNYESAAMWKLYIKSNEGIAIQSTFQNFTECFSETKERIYIGKVGYIDYESQFMPEGNIYYPFIHKRSSFEHEKEIRALVSEDWKIIEESEEPYDYGKSILVNLDKLIDKIYVSPSAPEWFKELVKAMLEKYNIDKEVVQSKLYDNPYYGDLK